jgi:hypothetical protein
MFPMRNVDGAVTGELQNHPLSMRRGCIWLGVRFDMHSMQSMKDRPGVHLISMCAPILGLRPVMA